MNKIIISPSMVIGDKSLFDQNTDTGWFPGWESGNYPAKITIDFGSITNIVKLRLFDGPGLPRLRFYADNQLLLETVLDSYLQWSERVVNWNVRTLTIELVDVQGEGVVREIEFYTPAVIVPPIEPPVINPPATIVGRKTGVTSRIGSNAFHWVSDERCSMLAHIRYYMANWMICSDKGLYSQPFKQAGVVGTLGLDDYLTRIKGKVDRVTLCLNQSPTVFSDQWGQNPECKPINKGDDPLNPASYYMMARYFYTLAAVYGDTEVPLSTLFIDTEERWGVANQLRTGLGKTQCLMPEIEIWNEQWAWWRNGDYKFTPEEYAVFYSMCYDGHEGRFPLCGVKTGCRNMKVVMGGMSEMNTEHLDRFLAHLRKIRTEHNIIDVINFHHYCNAGNDDGYMPKQWTVGCSPEQDKLEMRLSRMLQWKYDNQPHAEIYYSEAGYDSNLEGWSWQKSGGEVNQAAWLVRTLLFCIKYKIQGHIFNLVNEPNQDSGGLWQSSGICTNQASGYQPKMSYHLISYLMTDLNGFTYVRDMTIGEVRIFLFTKGRTSRYVYWTDNKSDVRFVIGNTAVVAKNIPQFITRTGYQPKKISLPKAPATNGKA